MDVKEDIMVVAEKLRVYDLIGIYDLFFKIKWGKKTNLA